MLLLLLVGTLAGDAPPAPEAQGPTQVQSVLAQAGPDRTTLAQQGPDSSTLGAA